MSIDEIVAVLVSAAITALAMGYPLSRAIRERDDARNEAEAANELPSELMRPTLQALDTRPVAAVVPIRPEGSAS